MRILGIVGSKRKNGNTATLVEKAIESAKLKGIDAEIMYLGDYKIEGCFGCEYCQNKYECIIDDDMQKLYKKVLESDAIIAGTPTYFYNMTSDMKAFIDRLYSLQGFDNKDRSVWVSVNEALGGKLAVTISISEQSGLMDMGVTSQAMDLSLQSLGYRIVDSIKILKLFGMNDAKSNNDIIEKVSIAGEKLAKTLLLKQKIKNKFKQ